MTTPQKDRSGRILIVDDEEGVAGIIAELLSEDFSFVETASNGHEGLEKHKENPYNVIISDLRMPVLGGIEFLKLLRDIDKETPFIVLTAYGDQAATVAALRLGAFDFLSKPFAPIALVSRVKDALNYSLAIKRSHDDIKNFTEAIEKEQYVPPKVKEAAQKLLAMQNIRNAFSSNSTRKNSKDD